MVIFCIEVTFTITTMDILVLFSSTGDGGRGHVLPLTIVAVLFSTPLDVITCEEFKLYYIQAHYTVGGTLKTNSVHF